jgi:chromosome segregation protein
MHLTSLEIVGFKSFAAKTTLHFHRGVTAVVGPNGCGKSNILDSIRWVLGEQSAKALRGGEMADVIFSGTDTRQPHNMAEVSLTFSDCEKELGVAWNELKITRRVFRDGKSDYLINGKACRLKDIHELFMDTGIGRSAYSIMEQGKLDQILSSRPDDRRAIFEEAAGITKFKSQKKEALRKLEYTESNLLRVTDIIKEVKRQIGSLQRQAGKARRYQSIASDLRVLDTHFSHRTYRNLEEEISKLSASMEQMGEARVQHESEIAEQEQKCSAVRGQLTEIDFSMEQTRDILQTLRNRIFSGESRVETHRERQTEFQAMIVRAQADRDGCYARIGEHEQEMERTDAQLTELVDVLRAEENLLQQGTARCTQAQQERVAAERATDALGHRLHGLENRLSDLRGKISVATGRRDAAQQRLEQVRSQQGSLEQNLITLQQRATEAIAASKQAQEALAKTKQELEEAQRFYENTQLERQHADRDWNALSKQLAERDSRRELLCQLEREGEGLGEGTQAILRGLNRPDFFQAGILGTLASLITVPNEEILAIEAALGAASRSVLFKDADVAEAALQTLKSAAQGRASVLTADWPYAVVDLGGLPEGGLAWASSLIQASEPVRVVVARLLEGVVIVENLETAFRLKRQYPQFAFAARTGEFIARDGVASGGTDGKVSASALLRRSQITALEKEVAGLRLEESRLAVARDASVTAVEQASERLKETRESVGHAQMMLSTAQGDERLATREFQETGRRQETLVAEVKTLEAQLQQLQERGTLDEEQLALVTTELATVRDERSAAQSQIASLRETETEATAALAEIRLRVATERQRQQTLTQQRGPIAARLRELAETIATRERDIREHETKIQKLILESQELSGSIEGWKKELLEVEGKIIGLTSQRTQLQESVESLEMGLRAARKNLLELQDRRSREEVRVTELRLRSESVCEHVSRRYQIELSEFNVDRYMLLKVVTTLPGTASEEGEVKESFSEIPWEKIEAMVKELTERVDAMGPVNIDAIQEYEELEERYTFLEKQNTDLINAKAELLEVISRINKTTKELFATTFEQVRLNFQEMFTELFGGGKANLLLVDDTDPLESGIEIIARPPGKQLQSISLLSGGERTMTAVALLFAIYMVKPSPFCVLDEMDAPLDESNIGRFIKLLDRFVDQSQFFVITHNKRTMSRADMLYGVTMEEQGVTKLISVKFQRVSENV